MTNESQPVCTDIMNAVAYFNWQWAGCGFGQLWVGKDKDGNIVIDSECMSKEATAKLLHAFVDKLMEEAKLR